MYINNIESYEKQDGHIYHLKINDNNADLDQINTVLESIESLDVLTINAPVNIPPKHIERLKLKALHINVGALDFNLKIYTLPSSVDTFSLVSNSLDTIPDKFWEINSLKIKTKKLYDQNFKDEIGHQDFMLLFDISNLSVIPDVIARKIVIQSSTDLRINQRFFERNDDVLKELSIDCNTLLSESNTQGLLKSLKSYTLKLKEEITHSSLAEIPNTLEYLSLNSGLIRDIDFSRFYDLQSLYVCGILCQKVDILSTKLRTLSIIDSGIITIANLNNTSLQKLTIKNSVNEFPEFVLQCTNLEYLDLSNNKIANIPTNWSLMINLKFLSLHDNKIFFENISFLDELKNIKFVNLDGNEYKNGKYLYLTRKKLPALSLDLSYLLDCENSRLNQVLKFSIAIAKSKLEDSEKRIFFDHYIQMEDFSQLLMQSSKNLLTAFLINYKPLKIESTKIVDKLTLDKNGIDTISGATVFVDGKTKLTKSEIKSIVEGCNAQLSLKWSDDITHVLLGDKPKDIRSFNQDLLYISENQLASLNDSSKFINVKVESGDNNVINKLKSLLTSEDNGNVNLGLKMIESGGVNQLLHSDLLAVAKSNIDAKVRKLAKKMLALHGPSKWGPLLENKLLFKNLNGKVREQEINLKLQDINEDVGIDLACELCLALYERHEKGLRFMMSRTSYPDEYAKRMHRLILRDGHLSIDKAMGFKNWKNRNPNEIVFNTYKTKISLPVSILADEKIESIGLHNTKFKTVPKDLVKFKDLKYIDLSCNNISKLPTFFSKLESVEELDLSFNIFEVFPIVLMKMKSLRKVDMRYNRKSGFSMGFNPLSLSNEIKDGLPNCEVLF